MSFLPEKLLKMRGKILSKKVLDLFFNFPNQYEVRSKSKKSQKSLEPTVE
jgi:hypothetical protein